MLRVLAIAVSVVLMLPCAGAGFVYEIAVDLFKFGRRRAAKAQDAVATKLYGPIES